MKKLLILLCACFSVIAGTNAQTGITCTDTLVAQVMMGNYNPAAFLASTIINDHDSISLGLQTAVSPDSLHQYLDQLRKF